MAIDFGKRFGLGTLRLPLKDPSDQKSIDYDQFCEMVDKFLDHGFRYFDFYLIHSITSQGYKECNEWGAFEFLAESTRSWQVPQVRRLPPRHARVPRPDSDRASRNRLRRRPRIRGVDAGRRGHRVRCSRLHFGS